MPRAHRRPFAGVSDYFTEVDRLRATGIHGPRPGDASVERTHADAWVPPADILADGDDLLIRLELPGVDPDDIDLHLSSGQLIVSAQRHAQPLADDDAYYLRELPQGEFRRVITLPEGTEPDQLSADFVNGLVQITARGCAQEPAGDRIALTDRSSGRTRHGVD